MCSRKNKTAGLKHQSGCMTAAACRHDFPVIRQLVALSRLKSALPFQGRAALLRCQFVPAAGAGCAYVPKIYQGQSSRLWAKANKKRGRFSVRAGIDCARITWLLLPLLP